MAALLWTSVVAAADVAVQAALDVGVAAFAPCDEGSAACRMLDEPPASSPLAVPFDEAIDADEIWPEIRRAESLYMAERLKAALQSAVEQREAPWGAVRVTPRPSLAFDVTVSGAILRSNSDGISFRARVQDARGVTWFAREYELPPAAMHGEEEGRPGDAEAVVGDAASAGQAPDDAASIGPFRALAQDMARFARQHLPLEERRRLRALAEVRFVREFSPDSFTDHLHVEDAGTFELKRLPAQADPMLRHGRRIRALERMFIDTLDDHYAAFSKRMATPYGHWRRAVQDGVITRRALMARAQARRAFGAVALVGGLSGQSGRTDEAPDEGLPAHDFATVVSAVANLYSASRESDAAVGWTEMLEQLGQSTSARISPHLIETENRTLRLTGAVNEQYDELRRILGELYEAETTDHVPSPEADFERQVAAAYRVVRQPSAPMARAPGPAAQSNAPTTMDGQLTSDLDDPLFALRPGGDFAPNPPPAAINTRRARSGPLLDDGFAGPFDIEQIFRDLEGGQLSRPMGAPRMPTVGPPRSVLDESSFEAETPLSTGDGTERVTEPTSAYTLEDLALLARERRERGDDAGALRMLEAGLDRVGILDEACPLVCSLVPHEPLRERWPRATRRSGSLGANDRVGQAAKYIGEGRIDDALDHMAPLLRRSKRLDLWTLEQVMRLHLNVASIEGSRGNPSAATSVSCRWR